MMTRCGNSRLYERPSRPRCVRVWPLFMPTGSAFTVSTDRCRPPFAISTSGPRTYFAGPTVRSFSSTGASSASAPSAKTLETSCPTQPWTTSWRPPSSPSLEQVVFDGYLRGLQEAGWDGDPRMVQLGMWSSAVKYDWLAPFTLAQAGLARQYRYGGGDEIDATFKFRGNEAWLCYSTLAGRAKRSNSPTVCDSRSEDGYDRRGEAGEDGRFLDVAVVSTVVGSRSVPFNVSANAYDRFMGRYSIPLAPLFADFAGTTSGQRVLDVGCEPGALTTELVRRVGPAAVVAVDPSSSFVSAVRRRHPGVEVHLGEAERLPLDDDYVDRALCPTCRPFHGRPDRRAARDGPGHQAWRCAGCVRVGLRRRGRTVERLLAGSPAARPCR